MGGQGLEVHTDVFEAARRVAYEYRDSDTGETGVPALAAKLGMPPGTLYNKLNLHESAHHKLTLSDVVQMTAATRDLRTLKALNHTFGCVCFEVPNLAHVSDEALLELVLKVGMQQGEFFRAIEDGLSDRKFSRAEYERIRQEGLDAIGAIVEATARVEGLIDG